MEFEVAILRGFEIPTPTFVELKATCREAEDLKFRLAAAQALLEATHKDIVLYLVKIQDFEHVNSEFRFASYTNDEELIIAYNDVIRLQRVASKLEFDVVGL